MSGKTKIEWAEATWHTITAAKRIGVSVEEYVNRLRAGEKWCTRCKQWHQRSIFPSDHSRGDGLSASCRGRAMRPPVQFRLFIEHERNEKARAYYRKYYAGLGGPAIRASKSARKRGLKVIPEWWRLEALQDGCAYCGLPAETLDHVIPVARGGESMPGNLVPACTTCNSRKKDSDPEPWIAIMRPEFLERIGTRPMGGIGALEIIDGVV